MGEGGCLLLTPSLSRDVEFPVPNNLDIDCIAVRSALIWLPGTICWPGFFFRGGGGGQGWSELGLSLSCLRA